MTRPVPDMSRTFQNNPESRLNWLVTALRLERLMAASPESLRHRLAQRRNRYFRGIVLLSKERDGDYELAAMRRMNCIFVHVPKTAGISVARGLFGSHAGGHFPLFLYLWLYGSRRFDAMFKFAFVRHPEARLLSAFHFLSKGGMLETDRLWAERWLSGCPSADAFVQERLPLDHVREALHFRPQTFFLTDPRHGRIGVDFLGRVEALDRDLAHVQSVLGTSATLPSLNRSGPRQGGATLSPASRRIVEEIYAEDYANFGY